VLSCGKALINSPAVNPIIKIQGLFGRKSIVANRVV
jgi:hypothetical protein